MNENYAGELRKRLIQQRDQLLANAWALQQQAAGVDIALTSVPDEAQLGPSRSVEPEEGTPKADAKKAAHYLALLGLWIHKTTAGEWEANGQPAMLDGGSNTKHPCFDGAISAAPHEGEVPERFKIVNTSNFLGVKGRTLVEAEANAHAIALAVMVCRTLTYAGIPNLAVLRELVRHYEGRAKEREPRAYTTD
jgi:hypothetical protein